MKAYCAFYHGINWLNHDISIEELTKYIEIPTCATMRVWPKKSYKSYTYHRLFPMQASTTAIDGEEESEQIRKTHVSVDLVKFAVKKIFPSNFKLRRSLSRGWKGSDGQDHKKRQYDMVTLIQLFFNNQIDLDKEVSTYNARGSPTSKNCWFWYVVNS